MVPPWIYGVDGVEILLNTPDDPEAALRQLDTLLEHVESLGVLTCVADLHRRRGELLIMLSEAESAEAGI